MALLVQGKYIVKGIKKYKGTLDTELNAILLKAGLPYKPYKFEDGRVLLVNDILNFGFLYSNKEEVFISLVLE